MASPSLADRQPRPPLLTKPFVWLTLGHFLQALGFSSMVLFPLYLEFLEASRTQIGLVVASASIGGLALRPAVGWALDVLGRRRTLFAGTAVLALAMVLIAAIDRIGVVAYLSRVLYGVGTGALFTAYFTTASDLIPPSRRTEGIALFGVSGLLPLAFVPVFEAAGIAGAELRWFFPVLGCVIATSLLCIRAVPEPERSASGVPFSIRGAIGALRARPVLPVWLATIVFASLVAVFMTFASVAAEARGGSAGTVWLTYALGAVGVRLFGARLPDRIGPTRMVLPSIGSYVLACVAVALGHSTGALALAGLLAGVGHGYCFPVLTTQVVERVPERLRGSGLAAFTALWDVSMLSLTPAFGLVGDTWGDAAIFWGAAGFAVVGIGFWGLLERRFGP